MSSRKKSPAAVNPDPELARWCADLSNYHGVTDVVPPKWFTAAQIAQAYGRSRITLFRHLKVQVASGKAEKKRFRIKCAKVVRPVVHYRLL